MALEAKNAVIRDGLAFRRGQRKLQAVFEDRGIAWEDGKQLVQVCGLPGTDVESQASWLALVNARGNDGTLQASAIDWNALLEAILANLPALLAICGL